jgi:protein-S-isoprenylcysteine O-methyltransferase Ste14
MYLAYVLTDIGYNLYEYNFGTVLLVITGWTSLFYRIHAEERMLSHDVGWSGYLALVFYRLLPGLW